MTELYRAAGFGAYPSRANLAVDPGGGFVYISADPGGSCVGEIVRVPVAGGEPEHVADGAHPVHSPDGRWLVYTVDGYTARGEEPPAATDQDLPCRYRHDSYVWRDLTDGREIVWIAPPPVDKVHQPNPSLWPSSFDPTSTRLVMGLDTHETSWVIVTPGEPAVDAATFLMDGLPALVYGLHWLPDGELLAVVDPPEVPLPDGVRRFHPPGRYLTGPADVSQTWWLVSGYDDDPRTGPAPISTLAWNQADTLIPIAKNAFVAWLPATPAPTAGAAAVSAELVVGGVPTVVAGWSFPSAGSGTTGRIDVLQLQPSWHPVASFPIPQPGIYDLPGASQAIVARDVTGDGRLDVLFPTMAAGNAPYVVVSDDGGGWRLVGFGQTDKLFALIPDEPDGDGLVTTGNLCAPSCAAGHVLRQRWRYSPDDRIFVEVAAAECDRAGPDTWQCVPADSPLQTGRALQVSR